MGSRALGATSGAFADNQPRSTTAETRTLEGQRPAARKRTGRRRM